jgi:hypothetical protein
MDGDTIGVLHGGSMVRVRLHGIDAPEREQDFSRKASEALGGRVFTKTVSVRKTDTDKHGRTVGIVFIDGEDVNRWLLDNGWAWHFKKYDSNPEYAEAEEAARTKKAGIWAGVNIVAPWDFRGDDMTPSANIVRAEARPTAKPIGSYWLNTNDNTRHNSGCRWFGRTKRGRYCGPNEGNACGNCRG